ncbi:MAG: dihydrofolate reductase [Nanoarchaeota archaeon]|nr:dihydrofolate reductase [Nanoarchaeota archaeon]MBU1644256.1 dihydrofolate reductase [Nanoarchaeota archaeon]MBU1977224.1 dihydrofolate reductase [Nanoarchaeota archaeon]
MKNIIAAMTTERVIGNNNSLPWHIPEDLKNFKRLTENNTVIMGRKTYDGLPASVRPLPNRQNIVVSNTLPPTEGISVCRSIEEAISLAESYQKEIFIIGGAAIYEQSLPLVERMYLSLIKKNYSGNAYFPEFEEEDWDKKLLKDYPEFELVEYIKK